LATLNSKQILFNFCKLNYGASYNYFGSAMDYNGFGIGFSYNYIGIIEIKGGELERNSNQLLLLFGIGRYFEQPNKKDLLNLDVGCSVKFIKNSYFNYNSYGTGFNLGIKANPQKMKELRFGVAFKNSIKLVRDIKYSQYKKLLDSDWYIQKLNLGIAYSLFGITLTTEAEKVFFIDSEINLKGGIEIELLDFFCLRSGYDRNISYGFGINPEDDLKFNCGFKNDIFLFDLEINY